jgi:ribosomal protein L23
MSLSMPLKPRVSEKAYGLSQLRNTYVFEVPGQSNKSTVADAVTSQFKVTVMDVNITNLTGKKTRRVRRGGRSTSGVRPGVKKAYVTLKAGDSIAIFANEEDKANTEPTKKDKK